MSGTSYSFLVIPFLFIIWHVSALVTLVSYRSVHWIIVLVFSNIWLAAEADKYHIKGMSVPLSKIVYSCNGTYSLIRGHMAMGSLPDLQSCAGRQRPQMTQAVAGAVPASKMWRGKASQHLDDLSHTEKGRKIGMYLICSDRNAVNLM